MDPGNATYKEVNKEWKATCRILFGTEVGELDEYSGWLSSLNDKFFTRNSSLSGKQVVFGTDAYCPGAKIISFDEVDFTKRFEPLSINEIKDMDSILEAVSERAYYCGSIIIGNSKFVESSSSVADSFFVYRSVKISGSKNIAYSQYLRLCENVFGTNEGGSSKFCIRGSAHYFNQRSFELWIGGNSSDCYYSYGLDACKDCMFSFNLVGKMNAIGNMQLPKDKYLSIKRKLLSEMAQELEQNERFKRLHSDEIRHLAYVANRLKDRKIILSKKDETGQEQKITFTLKVLLINTKGEGILRLKELRAQGKAKAPLGAFCFKEEHLDRRYFGLSA